MPFFDNSKSSHGRQTPKDKLHMVDTDEARSNHDVSSAAGDDDDDDMNDHAGTGGESSASDEFPSSSGSSGPKKQPEIASKEAKYVFLSKLLVMAVLIGSAAAASIVAYKFTKAQDNAEFEDQFHDYAKELIEVSGNTAYSTFSVLESFSKTVTSLAEFAQVEWPLLTIPHFEVRGSEYLRSSGAQLVSFAPVVEPDMRDLWEPYSVEHQDWIQQGIDYVLDVGRDDDNFLDRGNDNAMTEAAPIREEIWRPALRSSQPIRDYTEGPWVPLWQTYPPPQDSFIVNFNLMTHPSFEKLINKCKETRKAVLSEVLDNTVLFGNAKTNDVNPKSVVVEPIFSDFGEEADIVAFVVVIVPWDVYFQNVIFEGSHPITAVLRNDCGDAFTYQVDGPKAAFLGVGDLHDTTFDEFEMSTEFAQYVQRSVGGNATAAPHKHHVGLESYCEYSLHVYPTQKMKDSLSTNMPILITVGVICVFCFVSLIFILYDTLVTARQRKVANQASRTTAIVASLFPSEVHDRLFGPSEDDNKKKKGKLASHAPKFHLMNFLSDEENGLQNKDNNKNTKRQTIPFSSSKPIADLFPEATVMFADISGFTAWSSVREPSQVFILLETIYNAFDRIAKKRKVFKVETKLVGPVFELIGGY